MTFSELCRLHKATPTEREALLWHLAFLRMRKTLELRP